MNSKTRFCALLSLVITGGFFWSVWLLYSSQESSQALGTLVGSLGASFLAVVNYWLGSSLGSMVKTDQIKDLQNGR